MRLLLLVYGRPSHAVLRVAAPGRALSPLACASAPPPLAEKQCWRPTIDDVDRISWGRPAKRKGTGSRGQPHRLNDAERTLYDLARSKGFVEVAGSGWRSQRADAPLVNTFRSWCDARGVAAIFLHKGSDVDQVVLDLSPLRRPAEFANAAAWALGQEGTEGGQMEASESGDGGEEGGGEALEFLSQRVDDFLTEPIHRLPMYTVTWLRPRPEAKALAKQLAALLATGQSGSTAKKGRVKSLGGPNIKPGKSRRHGGYGIG